jgi:hypothetical protein
MIVRRPSAQIEQGRQGSSALINALLKDGAGAVPAGDCQGVLECEGTGNPTHCECVQDGKAAIDRAA